MKMNKINLNKGYVLIYDFNGVKIHNYNTSDYIDDQVILLEKNNKMIAIESPVFYENNKELEDYIKSLNVNFEGVLLSYHMGGGTFLEHEKKYATREADKYGHEGGGKSLVDNFTKAFGESLDNHIHNVTDYINEGTITLADIKMNIIPTTEAFDIEIPEINCIYTHMLGSDCHSIIAGKEHATQLIKELEKYIDKNYNLILTSHYIPENIDAVKTKIQYIKKIISISDTCNNANEMIDKVKKEYPNYSGENYLEMTANFFFNK